MELVLLASALAIMLVSLVGGIFTVGRVRSWVEGNLIYLNTFAAGVFVVVAFNILGEALSMSERVAPTILAVIAGFCLFFLAEYLLPESHCHHNTKDCVHDHRHKRRAWKVLLSDGIHNMGDGILLVPVFLINIQLGVIASIGIIIHELVQGVAQFFILKRTGLTTLQALQRNFIVSSTILIGILIGSFLTASDALVAPLIGFAAGGFVHILLVDLLPLTYKEARERDSYFEFIVAFALGVVLISLVTSLSEGFVQSAGLGQSPNNGSTELFLG